MRRLPCRHKACGRVGRRVCRAVSQLGKPSTNRVIARQIAPNKGPETGPPVQRSLGTRPMQANIQAWLDEQCRQINGAIGAVVLVLPRNSASLVPAAHWPAGGIPGEGLAAAAKSAYERREPLSQPSVNGAERPIPLGPMISCPIEVKGRTVGAVAVGFDPSMTLPPQ